MLRLRRKSDIQRCFRQGRRFDCSLAVVHARQRGREELPPLFPRVAVVAGRRFPTAVARSRARRILREACRLALRNRTTPWDLLLVARPKLLTHPFAACAQAVTDALQRAGVLAHKEVPAI